MGELLDSAERIIRARAAKIDVAEVQRLRKQVLDLAQNPKLTKEQIKRVSPPADMQKHDFFSHLSPLPGKKTPFERAKRFDTTAAAENILVGKQSGPAAIQVWFLSPGHHRNLLGPFRRVALGSAGKLHTMMFGG